MKNTKTMLMATVMMLGLAATVMAQPQERGKKGGQRGGDQSSQDRMLRFMQALPVMAALDADKDGTISAAEIAGASAALGKLDANGDGELSLDELRPTRTQGGQGKGGQGKSKGGAGGKSKGGAGGGKGKGGAGGKRGGGGEGGGQRPQRPEADE